MDGDLFIYWGSDCFGRLAGLELSREILVRNKFGAIKTEVDGIVFASRREASRYGELKLLQRAGQVSELLTQVKMPVVFEGKHICNYVADFVYKENGKQVVEDCKGFRTPTYKLKKRLVEAVYGVTILET